MSNSDNVSKPNPGVKVSANTDKTYQQTTAGTGMQKSEENYRKIVEQSVNSSPPTTYSTRRKR
jgi:hypothetical protein